MDNLTNEQKAMIYNEGIRRYNQLEEKINEIKSKSFEVSDKDQIIIDQLTHKMKYILNQTQRLR